MAVIVPFESHQPASIDRLIALVSGDMERVNTTILSRTGSDVTMIPEVANHLINSGGVYRLTPTQQIDFHVAFGLNRKAPDTIFGVGYSFRLDGLFARAR